MVGLKLLENNLQLIQMRFMLFLICLMNFYLLLKKKTFNIFKS